MEIETAGHGTQKSMAACSKSNPTTNEEMETEGEVVEAAGTGERSRREDREV